MNYGQIRKYDIANGNGIRTSILLRAAHISALIVLMKNIKILRQALHGRRQKLNKLLIM